LRANRKELETLAQAAKFNRDIATDSSLPEDQRREAEQRLAEIFLRVELLKLENQRI
jgi:hypothetical protein